MPGVSRKPAEAGPQPAVAGPGAAPALAPPDAGMGNAFAAMEASLPAPKMEAAGAPISTMDLFQGTIDQLQANFQLAVTRHPEIQVTWEQVLPAVTLFVNQSAKASDAEARTLAAKQLTSFLTGLKKTGPAPGEPAQTIEKAKTTTPGDVKTGGGLASGEGKAQLWSGGDMMKKNAMKQGDALEGTFAGTLFDNVTLKLKDGSEPKTGAIWDEMSRAIAAGMSGHLTINTMFAARDDSVFSRVESKEIRALMASDPPIVTGITVKRYLREPKGTDSTGRPYTTSTSNAVLEKDVKCKSVDEVFAMEPYKPTREDANNPYFAVAGGHTTGAPPKYDPNAAGAPAASSKWGWEKGLKADGKTPEW